VGISLNIHTTTLRTSSIQQLRALKEIYRPRKTLLVTGNHSFKASGARALIDECFNTDEIIHFNDFEVNPQFKDAVKGTQLAIDNNIDCIVAVGGGSALDVAKLIKAFLSHAYFKAQLTDAPQATSSKRAASTYLKLDVQAAEQVVRGKEPIPPCAIPFIAIPTTAGSGSEATHFAVAYIDKQKFSVASPVLHPSAHILEGSFLASAAPYQKAVNGLDALAQAIEGYWAVSSSEESRGYSLEAIKLLMMHLSPAIETNNIDDLDAVMQAAHLAGKVINVTKTTAPHAFSYGFTSFYKVPHGHAVWLTLPSVFQLHCYADSDSLNDPRGLVTFQQIMDDLCDLLKITDASSAKRTLQQLMVDLGVEPSMLKLGVTTKQQRRFLSEHVNIERLKNNPLKLSSEHIEAIFEL
jgi:alcohol dehydrogenase class IV